MAISPRSERRAFLWRIWARALPPASEKPATLDEVISILEGEVGSKSARVYLGPDGKILDVPGNNPKNQLYIADIKRNPAEKVISLVINRGDPGWVDPALLDPQANAVRIEHPHPKEAPGWSAHLVISTSMHGGAHRACFEQVRGVSGNLVLDAMDRIVADALKGNPAYTYEIIKQKGGKPNIQHKPYRPALEVTRSPSERLLEDLEQGVLTGVTFSRESKQYAGLGLDKIVKQSQEQLVISLEKTSGKTAADYIHTLIGMAKDQGFEQMSVKITGLAGGQSSGPALPLDDQEAFEHLYVRAKRITDFGVHLEQCYEQVYPPIEKKLIEEIHDPSNWTKS
jgi:hypothetical protein